MLLAPISLLYPGEAPADALAAALPVAASAQLYYR
jgi:hypothetical protein